MNSEKNGLKLLMFPWLAHGHITPFTELAKALSHKNFHSYICSTPANLNSIRTKINGKYSLHIHLIELHLPSSPQLPPLYHTTNGLPLHLHPTLRTALRTAKPKFSDLVKSLQPDLLIHDVLQIWAAEVASRNRIPSVAFFTSGATMFSYFSHLGKHPGVEFPFPAIRLTGFELSMAIGHTASYRSEETDPDPDDEAYRRSKGVILVNSSREIEGKYIDYLSGMMNKEIVPIGAIVHHDDENDDDDDAEMMEWLGRKGENSSVFVSFGSEYFPKQEEIEEIAYGLELSDVNFIWIVRFMKGEEEKKIDDVLPRGFVERVGDRCKIVENWAPQAKILRHPSIGGFVSHCGWNSLKESIEFGVPIIGMPMHLDQPMNAKLVLELGVGVEVKRDGNGRLQREEIGRVVKDVAVGETGEILRRKVGEERERIRSRSREEMEGVAEMLAGTKFCE
ncbi:hypothetical protein ACS0TY_009568 [Phlomoides rotata]